MATARDIGIGGDGDSSRCRWWPSPRCCEASPVDRLRAAAPAARNSRTRVNLLLPNDADALAEQTGAAELEVFSRSVEEAHQIRIESRIGSAKRFGCVRLSRSTSRPRTRRADASMHTETVAERPAMQGIAANENGQTLGTLHWGAAKLQPSHPAGLLRSPLHLQQGTSENEANEVGGRRVRKRDGVERLQRREPRARIHRTAVRDRESQRNPSWKHGSWHGRGTHPGPRHEYRRAGKHHRSGHCCPYDASDDHGARGHADDRRWYAQHHGATSYLDARHDGPARSWDGTWHGQLLQY